MGDSKESYSQASEEYISKVVPSSKVDMERYIRSKERESRYNEMWKSQPVNINEIVEKFVPGVRGRRRGVKFLYENEAYRIVADLPAGYLRIFDKSSREYTLRDGVPCKSNELTHFKILRREEM